MVAVTASEDDEIKSTATMEHSFVTLGQCIAAIPLKLLFNSFLVKIRSVSNVSSGIQLDSQSNVSFNLSSKNCAALFFCFVVFFMRKKNSTQFFVHLLLYKPGVECRVHA